jgi:hypothetical protein
MEPGLGFLHQRIPPEFGCVLSMPFTRVCRFINVMSGRCNRNFSTASSPLDASATDLIGFSVNECGDAFAEKSVVVNRKDSNQSRIEAQCFLPLRDSPNRAPD